MRVLLINNRHFHSGGADVVYFSTGELLEDTGHEVLFFSKHSEDEEKYQFSKFFAPTKGTYSFVKRVKTYCNNKDAAKALDALLERKQFDIAHVHLLWGGLTAAIIPVLHKHGIPIVHTAHDYRMVCPAYLLKDGKGYFCERCKGGRFFQCALHKCCKGNLFESFLMSAEMYYRNRKWHPASALDGILFVSNFSKRKHIEFDNKFENAKTTVLYNCPGVTVQESLDLEKDTFNSYYLFYGRLSQEKGIPTLIRSFEKYPRLDLKIVGPGPLEDEYRTYCEKRNIKNIEFLGYKTGKELFDLVVGAKYVCVPSECYENNPMTIVESYSLSTPVIGAAIGGISEIVKNDETGYTFESGNVENLVATIGKTCDINKEKYKRQKTLAYNFAKENFSRENHYKRLIAFYQDVLKTYHSK